MPATENGKPNTLVVWDRLKALSTLPQGGETMAEVEPTHTQTSAGEEELLTPAEVARMFRVNPKTVTRWARAGKISAIRTLGGHRRFRASDIRKILEGGAEG